MAASTLSRLARQTSRFAVCALRRHALVVNSKRSFSSSNVLAAKLFTEKHEWIEVNGNVGTIGISKYAQESLGEIVYVQLPDVGSEVEAGGESGCLESVKAASDIYSPASGKVAEVNSTLTDKPNLINESPLDNGWIFKVELTDKAEMEGLMDEAAYTKFLETHE